MGISVEKKEQIGVGGLGPVFRGSDRELRRDVIIRELAKDIGEDSELTKRYLTWMRKFATISHPSVLTVHAIKTDQHRPWVVLELMTEGTLRDFMAEGPATPERVADVLRQALHGLRELHRRELVHGDLRPENVFLARDTIKIGDPGLPAFRKSEERLQGSARYKAPETLTGQGKWGTEADLYSAGFMMYELALGPDRFRRVIADQLRGLQEAELDLGSGTTAEIDRLWVRLHLSTKELPLLHDLDPTLPSELSSIVAQMLRKDPKERYSSCSEPLSELGEMRGWTAMLAAVSPPKKASEASETAGSGFVWASPRVLTATILALLVLAAGGVLVWLQLGSEPGGEPHAFVSEAKAARDIDSSGNVAVRTPWEALLTDLEKATSQEKDLRVGFAKPSAGKPSVKIGSQLSFEVTSRQDTHAMVFVLTSDGSVGSLYPNRRRPALLQIKAGEAIIVPRPEDSKEGFELRASTPLGRDRVFVLGLAGPLSPPTKVTATSVPGTWLVSYPCRGIQTESPAANFLRWVLDIRHERPQATRLVEMEYEVVAREAD